jgi:hypothetical protein
MLSPDALHKIAEDTELAKAREALVKKKQHDEEERAMRESFMAGDVQPDAMERLTRVLERAAGQGLREIQVMRFPAAYCNDGGRAINNFEAEWPASLEGHAKRAYAWFQKHLEPQGFKVRAEVLSYPGGNLGDIGLFLSW